MFIMSPAFCHTPRALAHILGSLPFIARPGRRPRRELSLCGARDFWSYYPAALRPYVSPDSRPAWDIIHSFASLDKPAQRAELETAGIPTLGALRGPYLTGEGLFVIRPNRHFGGRDFQVVEGPCRVPRGFYAAPFYAIAKEFRTVIVRGRALFTMYKPPIDDLAVDTILDSEAPLFAETWSYTRLDRCDLLSKLLAFPAIAHADYCGVDIAWFGREERPRVIEVNFAPGLGPRNLQSVAAALSAPTN